MVTPYQSKADPEGIVEFEAVGTKYKAKFGFRAQKEVEKHFDKPFMAALESVMPQIGPEDANDEAKLHAASAGISLTNLGEMFRFSLLAFHPDMEPEEVEEIIDDIGLPMSLAIMMDALKSSRSFNAEAGRGNGRPQRRPAKKTG